MKNLSLQTHGAKKDASDTSSLESVAMARVEALHKARAELVLVAKMLEEFSKQSRVAANSLAEVADLLASTAEEEDERAELVHLISLHAGNITNVAKELGVTPAYARRVAERMGVTFKKPLRPRSGR